MLSQFVNDPKLIQASQNAVRVIIRRPHAYKFKRDHPKAAIPSLLVMNAAGKMLGGTAITSSNAVSTMVDLLEKNAPKPVKKTEEPPAEPEKSGSKVTFHVMGMKKTLSGAT